MPISHTTRVRAQAGRAAELGRCLQRLASLADTADDCLGLEVRRAAQDEQLWLLRGDWYSARAMQRFFAAPLAQQVFTDALGAGLISSLNCGCAEPAASV
jgi:quinol monooxygenase YgiN